MNGFKEYKLITPAFGLHKIIYVGETHHRCRKDSYRECYLPNGAFLGYISSTEIREKYIENTNT